MSSESSLYYVFVLDMHQHTDEYHMPKKLSFTLIPCKSPVRWADCPDRPAGVPYQVVNLDEMFSSLSLNLLFFLWNKFLFSSSLSLSLSLSLSHATST